MLWRRSLLAGDRPSRATLIVFSVFLVVGVALACTHGEVGDPDGPAPPGSGSDPAPASTSGGGAGPGRGDEAAEGESQVIELRMKEAKEVDGMTLEWVELRESRCPRGVTCIWAGEAVVAIDYAADGESGRIELGLQAREVPGSRNVAGRGLTLLSVEPYPEAEPAAKQGEQRIELRVGPPVEGGPGSGAAVS